MENKYIWSLNRIIAMDANVAKKHIWGPKPRHKEANRVRVILISEGRMFQRTGAMVEKAYTSPGPHWPTFLG